MQGHDVLFDIENNRIGIAESTCDYNYLISGKRSEEFDPFDLDGDIRRFYTKNFCQSSQCRSYISTAFWVSHSILLLMYYVLQRRRNRKTRSCDSRTSQACGIKLKMSEDMEAFVE